MTGLIRYNITGYETLIALLKSFTKYQPVGTGPEKYLLSVLKLRSRLRFNLPQALYVVPSLVRLFF
jgi:hypothetical protein